MTTKQYYWLDHVKAANNSDDTIADYALANSVRLKTLYQWKTKLATLGHYKGYKLVDPISIISQTELREFAHP